MKKVISLLLAFVLVVGLVGCSGTPTQETNTAKPTETTPVATLEPNI